MNFIVIKGIKLSKPKISGRRWYEMRYFKCIGYECLVYAFIAEEFNNKL